MSSRVSLSRRDAKILDLALGDPDVHSQLGRLALRALDRLRLALAPKPKRVAATKARKAKVATKRATKREETARIYDAASERADRRCEACNGWFSFMDQAELDHARGRGRVRQALSNVWLIHQSCHRARHAGSPSREHWLDRWADHCRRHGYSAEAFDADAKLESRSLIQAAAAVTGGRNV